MLLSFAVEPHALTVAAANFAINLPFGQRVESLFAIEGCADSLLHESAQYRNDITTSSPIFRKGENFAARKERKGEDEDDEEEEKTEEEERSRKKPKKRRGRKGRKRRKVRAKNARF